MEKKDNSPSPPTPPRSPPDETVYKTSSSEYKNDDADASSQTKTAEQGTKTEHERRVGFGLPIAIKTASVVAIPAPQTQLLPPADILTSEKTAKPKTNGEKAVPRVRGRGRPKGVPSEEVLKRLRPRGRGPPGSQNIKTPTDKVPGQPTAKRPRKARGTSDKFQAQIKMQQQLCLHHINTSPNPLFTEIFYGGYRTRCLPPAPVTEAEKRKESLQVAAHFRKEKEDAMAKVLSGQGETETQDQNPSKPKVFEWHKRDLKDHDSYDVLGTRVDPDGTVRYFIAWKIPGVPGVDDTDSDEDEAEVEWVDNNGLVTTSSMMPKGPSPDEAEVTESVQH